MPESFDVIVIGGGPGGYVAAIRAAQLGQKTAVVERDKAGGRCLNYACIPAKTILRSAEIFDEAKNGAELGIVGDVSIDWDALQARRAKVSESLSRGVEFLWDKGKITKIEGEGSLTADGNVSVGGETYEAKAVCSRPARWRCRSPGVEFGGRVVDTWGAWSLAEQPKKIAVVGAGASGSEIASAYARLGTEVILIEMLPQILPAEDKDIAESRRTRLQETGHRDLDRRAGGERRGRRGLASSSPTATSRPRSTTSASPAVAVPTPRRWASRRRACSSTRAAARSRSTSSGGPPTRRSSRSATWSTRRRSPTRPRRRASSRSRPRPGVETEPVDQDLLVGATFTHPQVASVGLTEAAAKEAGHEVKVGKQKISGEGAGTVYDDKDGIVKLVVDAKYGEILGAHIVGNRACDMIAELVAVMALEGGAQEVARIVHPHPTVSRGRARRGARGRRLGDPRLAPLGAVAIDHSLRRNARR